MARMALLLALVAGAFASQASAQLALCSRTGVPAAPKNLLVNKNVWDDASRSSVLTVNWYNPTTPSDGCTDFYRYQMFVNGKQVSEEGVQLSSPIQSRVEVVKKGLKAGDFVTFKVYAMNKGTQKKSASVSTSPVMTKGAGISTGRRMM